MGFIEVTLKLDEDEFTILNNFKKKELNKLLHKIFKTGYQIHFPSKDKLEQQVELNELLERIDNIKDELKDEINNSEINEKINSLETSLTKLIGISSNSCKKGNFGENVLEEIFSKRYGDITFERKSQVAHSGDAWLYLPDNKVIMLESKNYTTTVDKPEIIKLQSDMITHNIKWGLLVSFNSMIQGMRELDFHTFSHEKNTYSVIMISNLSTDIHKLDLGLQIIRKLMTSLDNVNDFPWVVNDINSSLSDLNKIIEKNYMLRDSYYNMETEIQKTMSNYHKILRDYQYDIELKIKEIIDKIKNTMDTSVKTPNPTEVLLQEYQDRKILPLIVRLIDLCQYKSWSIKCNEDKNEININDIGVAKIQAKKIVILFSENNLTLALQLGKDKDNKKNIEIMKTL